MFLNADSVFSGVTLLLDVDVVQSCTAVLHMRGTLANSAHCKLGVACRTKEQLQKGKGLLLNTGSVLVYIIRIFKQVLSSKDVSAFSAMNSILYVH